MLATFLSTLAVGIAFQALRVASQPRITVYVQQPVTQVKPALPSFINNSNSLSKEGLYHHDN